MIGNFTNADYFKQPLRGRLIDKMQSSADTINMTYPRFESYDMGMTIKTLPQCFVHRRVSLQAQKCWLRNARRLAKLTFYARDGKTKLLSARSQSLSIRRGDELGANKLRYLFTLAPIQFIIRS